MPRLKNRPPKLRRHKSGQAFVTVNGQSIYLGRFGSAEAKTAYRAFKKDWKPAPVATPTGRSDGSRTIAELLLQFVTHAETRYVKNGVQTSTLGTFKTPIRVLRELFGDRRIKDFGPLKLEVVRDRFVELGVSRTVANRYTRLIIKMFRWGVSRELVPVEVPATLATLEPLRHGSTTAPENAPVKPVEHERVQATLKHLNPVVADMVKLQAATGARPYEIVAIRPCDIDRTTDVWQYKPKGHKLEHKGVERVIYLGPRAQEVLKRYLLRESTACCFSPREAFEYKPTRRRKRQWGIHTEFDFFDLCVAAFCRTW